MSLVPLERLGLPGQLTRTSLTLRPDLTFAEWRAVGELLQEVESGVLWWVGDWLVYGEKRYGNEYREAIEKTGYGRQTLYNALWVCKEFGQFSRRRENCSFSHHAEVAGLEPAEADKWLDLAVANGWSRNELRARLVEARRLGRVAGLTPQSIEDLRPVPLTLADPPWQYDFTPTESRAIENQYPTMTVDALCAMPVQQITTEDAVMFLWATSPKLREALQVIEAWGFEYRTGLVWVKDKIGMGYWARQQHELLLVCTRGSPPPPAPSDRPSSVIEAPRGVHSAKPVEVYETLERLYPQWDGHRRELFARTGRAGWLSWGNEVPRDALAPRGTELAEKP